MMEFSRSFILGRSLGRWNGDRSAKKVEIIVVNSSLDDVCMLAFNGQIIKENY